MNTDDEGATWTGHYQTPYKDSQLNIAFILRRLDEIDKTLSNIITLLRRNGS